MVYLTFFFSFYLTLKAKWTFLRCQVIAALYIHVKIEKWIVCDGEEMVEKNKKNWTGFRCKE